MDTATREPHGIAPPSPPAQLFGDYSPAVTCASALILVLAIATIDKLTGYDLQLGFLHLVPIAMVTWAVGRVAGLAFSVLALGLWMMTFRGAVESRASLYFYWDGAVLLGVFVAFALVLGRLREVMRAFELSYLDELPAPAYAIDAAATRIVYGNRVFRETLGGHTVEELARYPAIETRIRWKGWRRARLRILVV
jgi:hypothetical protein